MKNNSTVKKEIAGEEDDLPIGDTSGSGRFEIPFRSLVPFLIISFALAWGVLALYIFLPEQMADIFGPLTGQHPLFFLAVYAPAIAAFAVVLRLSGIRGLKSFLSRLLIWRTSVSWYFFLFAGIPIIFVAGSLIKGTLLNDPFPFSSFSALLTATFLSVIKGPVEEFGWRGVALPLLQRKFAPLWAGIILGIIWGVWHTPAFLLSGTQQSEWSFVPFFIGCIALSIIVTPLFNQSNGSILLTAFYHFMVMNPVFPDAQPYDTWILVGIAFIVVWRNKNSMFAREGAVTRVIPAKEQDN
jgi:membrane protease YdiL (CAAX protease family)